MSEKWTISTPEAQAQEPKFSKENFDKNLDAGNLERAEQDLNDAREKGLIDARGYDHRQHDLLDTYYAKGDKESIRRMIVATVDWDSREGRIDKFNSEFDENCDDLRLPEPEGKKLTEEEIDSFIIKRTDSFRELLKTRGEHRAMALAKAKTWVDDNKNGKYKGNDSWLRDRLKELTKAE